MMPLLEAEALVYAHPGAAPLFGPLSFTIGAGLTWVRGGDGRGKTTLLRLLSGRLAPTAGMVRRAAGGSVFHEEPTDPAHDAVTARDWLAACRLRHPGWQPQPQEAWIDAFGLRPHVDKPLYMLSAGSRRKLGLVAAAASGAALTLLDQPQAALDPPSRRSLGRLLHEAAAQAQRAWVVADHEIPTDPAAPAWAGLIDLGD